MAPELNTKDRLRWEQRLLGRIAEGDSAAFADLYREYAPRLFQRVLLPRLGNRESAEDALSETFRTALERLASFEAEGVSVYFWLSRIAINKATDMHRVKSVTKRALTNFEGMLAPLVEHERDAGQLLEHALDSARVHEQVRSTLVRINERYRRAIELRFLQGQSREACAEALEVKLGTFDVLLLRALRAFRKQWEVALATEEVGT